MKKRLLSILLVGIMVFGLAACSSESSEATDETADDGWTGKDLKISVILKTLSSEYWDYVQAGAKAYANENSHVSVTIKGPAAETEYAEQAQMVEDAIASTSYDAFVIAPTDEESVKNKISREKRPIVAVDTVLSASEVQNFVGTDNENAAKGGGEKAVEMAQERGWEDLNAIAIAGIEGETNSESRVSGYKEGIESGGGTLLTEETQYAESDSGKATEAMQTIMENHPEGVAMIVCHNDDTAIAAAKAAADNEAYANTVFCGFDGISSACKAILNGQETLTVAQNAYEMGYTAVENAVKLVQGEELDVFTDTGYEIINSENAQEKQEALKESVGRNW